MRRFHPRLPDKIHLLIIIIIVMKPHLKAAKADTPATAKRQPPSGDTEQISEDISEEVSAQVSKEVSEQVSEQIAKAME